MKNFIVILSIAFFSTCILSCSPKAGSAMSGDTENSSLPQSQPTTGSNSPGTKKSFAPKNPSHDSKYNYSLQPRK